MSSSIRRSRSTGDFARADGASTIADLGAHLIDLAGWMVGRVESVSAQSGTFTRRSGRARRAVDNDDASSALLRFQGGALGVFETAKVAPCRPCDFIVEVNGTRGTLRFDYGRLNELWYGDTEEPPGAVRHAPDPRRAPEHPETRGWWPIGQGIGYGASFVNQAADLLEHWPDANWTPDLETGLEVQAVAKPIEQAASQRRSVDVAEIRAGTQAAGSAQR